MKLTITWKNSRPLGYIALTTRLFVAVAIDQPDLLISNWMSAILGGLLCAPLLLAARYFPKHCSDASPLEMLPLAGYQWLSKAAVFLFAILLLLDSANTIGLMALLADYTTTTSLRSAFLILPLVAALFFALMNNSEGIGGAARLWLYVLPLLLLVVFLQHMKTYNPRWLLPILGSGSRLIALGGVRAADALVPAALLWLSAEQDASPRGQHTLSLLAFPALVGAILLMLHTSMTPAQISESGSRLFQLDSIISNGRAALGTQMPMTLVWFAGLLFTLAFDLFLASLYLQRTFERIDGKLCLASVCALAGTLSLICSPGGKKLTFLVGGKYLIISVLYLILLIAIMKVGKEADHS